MSQYPRELIADLLAARMSSEDLERLQRQEKDPDRLEKVLSVEQERLGWEDPIILCLQEHLFIVQRSDGARVVRCDCGQEFGDCRRNWKEAALVRERDQPGDVYRGPRMADPDWTILREFYCPGCASQLDVEVVPRGYPFVFNFVPDFAGDEGGAREAQ